MTSPGIAELYVSAVDSFIALARTFDDDAWGTRVPCTPAWTVRDVLSHVSGIPDDAFAGRLDGVATDPWTASQVERNAQFSVDELLERWESQYEGFADVIESMGQGRPPFDCHTHEHDVRHALGLPGQQDHPVVVAMSSADTIGDAPAALTIEFTDGGSSTGGSGGPEVGVRLSRFEYFRSRLGRRSRRQLEAYDWSGDAAAVRAVQDAWWIFGTAESDIVE